MSLSIEMQCWKQVDPIGIAPSNQIELPTPFPCLDRLLASNRLLDRIIGLDEHETSQAVPLAEIGSGNRAMLVNASGDVGGDAGIKRAARCICHDVDVTPLHRRQLAPEQTWMPACAGLTDSTNRWEEHTSDIEVQM